MTRPKRETITMTNTETAFAFLAMFDIEQLIYQTNLEGWMVGVWDGTKLGWIPTDWDESQYIIFLSQSNPN